MSLLLPLLLLGSALPSFSESLNSLRCSSADHVFSPLVRPTVRGLAGEGARPGKLRACTPKV